MLHEGKKIDPKRKHDLKEELNLILGNMCVFHKTVSIFIHLFLK